MNKDSLRNAVDQHEANYELKNKSQKYYVELRKSRKYICRWSTLEFHKNRITVNLKKGINNLVNSFTVNPIVTSANPRASLRYNVGNSSNFMNNGLTEKHFLVYTCISKFKTKTQKQGVSWHLIEQRCNEGDIFAIKCYFCIICLILIHIFYCILC